MNTNYSIPWKRLLVEGAVIVVSILLAFWIDASWDRHLEQKNEEAFLDVMEQVLADSETWVLEGMQYASSLRRSARQLIEIANNPEAEVSDEELDALLSDMTWYVDSMTPPDLAGLLSSATLGHVRDPELARELAVLGGYLRELNEMITMGMDFYSSEMMPYLQKNAHLAQLNNVIGFQPSTSIEYPKTTVTISSYTSHRALLEDQEFQNLLMRWVWRLTDIIEFRQVINEGGQESGLARARDIIEEYRRQK